MQQTEIAELERKSWYDVHKDGRRLDRMIADMEEAFRKQINSPEVDQTIASAATALKTVAYAIQTKHSLANKIGIELEVSEIKQELAEMRIHMGLSKLFR